MVIIKPSISRLYVKISCYYTKSHPRAQNHILGLRTFWLTLLSIIEVIEQHIICPVHPLFLLFLVDPRQLNRLTYFHIIPSIQARYTGLEVNRKKRIEFRISYYHVKSCATRSSTFSLLSLDLVHQFFYRWYLH